MAPHNVRETLDSVVGLPAGCKAILRHQPSLVAFFKDLQRGTTLARQ
jgi:hypothetical protein